MVKVVFCFICFFFFFVSCRDEVMPPAQILNHEKLVAILTDMHMAEGFVRLNKLPEGIPTDSAFYAAVYRKHSVTIAQVDSAFKWYTINNPGLMEKIYEEVLEKLSNIETSLKNQ